MRAVVMLIILILPGILLAQSNDKRMDGYSLHKECTKAIRVFELTREERKKLPGRDVAQALQCIEYVRGALDGLTLGNVYMSVLHEDKSPEQVAAYHSICIPKISVRQAIQLVYTYMNDNPDSLQQPRFMVIGKAMLRAFPPPKYCTPEYYAKPRKQ